MDDECAIHLGDERAQAQSLEVKLYHGEEVLVVVA